MKAIGAFAVVLLVLAAVTQEGSAYCDLPVEPGAKFYSPNRPHYMHNEEITIFFDHPKPYTVRQCDQTEWFTIL